MDPFFYQPLDLLFFIAFALLGIIVVTYSCASTKLFNMAEVLRARVGSSGSDLGHDRCFSVCVSICLVFVCISFPTFSISVFFLLVVFVCVCVCVWVSLCF